MGLAETYDGNQNFNAATRWLHAQRYRHVLKALRGRESLRVLDIGCGTGRLFEVLDGRFRVDYVGIERDERFTHFTQVRYGHRPNYRIITESALTAIDRVGHFDVICALETLEHIERADVLVLLDKIRDKLAPLMLFSVPVEIGPSVWLKNVGSALCGYSRHLEYSWRETFWAGLYQLDRLPPHGTSHKGFDWRWLHRELARRFLVRRHRLPFRLAPPSSMFFLCTHR